MSLSIRWRLAAGIIIAFVVTLAALFFTVQFALQRILTDDLDDGLSEDARRVIAQFAVAPEIDASNVSLQEDIQENASTTEGRTAFITVLRDTSGRAIVWTRGVQEARLALSPEELQEVLAGGQLKQTVELPGANEYRVRTQRLTFSGDVKGVVQVARVTEPVVGPVSTLLVILVLEGIAATIITIGIALWLSRGAVKPLQRVIDVAAEIQASDLRRRIEARHQPEEVQKLADTFDAMLERLEKAFQEQRNFVMDVSHELRTPLTVLKGNLEVMLMDAALDAELRAQYEMMSAEVSRLIRLTSNLLYIASAQAGREPERRAVELDLVCMEVVRQSRDLRPDVRLGLRHQDQVTVMGDRDQIRQMVLNLVENAVKYTPSGGEVALSLRKDNYHASIAVSDTGPGIPADILPHIFERFYRGNHRSMMGGTGLGLAIADRIARSHGGSIDVESKEGAGSTFTVSIPVSEDRQPEAPS
jgi:two-component system, OmpR family, sensor kinase